MQGNIVSEAVLVFVVRILGVGFTFAYTAMITRALGASESGIFFLAQTIIMILTLVSRLGFDNLIVRKMSIYAGSEDQIQSWEVLGKVVLLVVVFSLILFLTINFLSAPLQSLFAAQGLETALSLLSIGIPLLAVLFVFSEALKGLSYTIESTITQSLTLPLIYSLILYLSINRMSLGYVLWGYVFAAIISLVTVTILLKKKIGVPSIKLLIAGSENARSLLVEALPLLWAGAAGLVFSWTDTLVLGVVQNSEEVGFYVVASRSSQLISLILMVANTLLGVRFAHLYHDKKMAELRRLFFKTAGVMLLLAGVSVLPYLLYPKIILGLFGSQFVEYVVPMKILAVGQFINVASGAGGILLVMVGRSKSLQYIMLFVMLFNLVFSYVLGGAYSGSGVAIATALSLVLLNAMILFKVNHFFKTCGSRNEL